MSFIESLVLQLRIKVNQALWRFGTIAGSPFRRDGPGAVALQAFLLGSFLGLGLGLTYFSETFRSFGLYMVFLSFFHFMEYILTALFNSNVLSADSFLINHSTEYTIAFIASLIEYIVELYFFPGLKTCWYLYGIGVVMSFLGEGARIIAMSTSKSNFKHEVASVKIPEHQLVTHGIYAVSRHPAYFGWFYFTTGTQIILCNPICAAGFAFVAYRFFKDRIEYEEENLIEFFGDAYVSYKTKVPTLIPGIK